MLSVVICTRDPVIGRLRRVLEGLALQSLPLEQWRLLVVDNGSSPPLAVQLDLSWHPRAEVIVEPKPGLTPARLRGIASTSGHLVFVDDDNVLAPDYLECAARRLEVQSWMGAFGGSIELEFEQAPPEWTKMFHGMLAERRVEREQWSKDLRGNPVIPCGAGMVVRREVADAYRDLVKEDAARLAMDRREDSMISDGDTDLALTACDLGLACGQCSDLKLTHLIPASRLTVEYFERLAHGMAYSGVLVRSLRKETQAELRKPSLRERLHGGWQSIRLTSEQRRVRRAWARGRDEALRKLGLG